MLSAADLLDRLIAGKRPQRRYIRLCIEQVPQPPGACLGVSMFDRQCAAKLQDLFGAIGSLNSAPARVGLPFTRQGGHFVRQDLVAGEAVAKALGLVSNGLHECSSSESLPPMGVRFLANLIEKGIGF